jgi:hypothetical protein
VVNRGDPLDRRVLYLETPPNSAIYSESASVLDDG